MTAPEHKVSASAGRAERWAARCSCGWWTPCTGTEDASRRMQEHRDIAKAAVMVQHDCYEAESMEYGICARCILDGLLKARAA